MHSDFNASGKLRVCAVNYLNTVPLVWGMLHGAQKDMFELKFSVPSECADRLAAGTADIGTVPSVELPRLNLKLIPGAGIASRGAIRSILLISKVPPDQISVVAADTSSRTSTVLARIVLARRYGCEPRLVAHAPDLPSMLETADAAVIIGDPALRLDPASLPFLVTDLSEEWTAMTGLPMVFAVWAGREERVEPNLASLLLASCRFGLARLDEIVEQEAEPRGLSRELAHDYLTRRVTLELGEREYAGLDLFLQYAAEFTGVEPYGKVSA